MTKYRPEFKLEVVRSVLEDRIPAGEVAKKYCVNKTMFRQLPTESTEHHEMQFNSLRYQK